MEQQQSRFGIVRAFAKDVEQSRTIDFVISDDSKDRHNTILSPDGWVLDAYNRNGVVGYMHNIFGGDMCEGPDPDMVIAKGVVKPENNQLIGITTFEPKEINENAEKIFRKLLFGSLSSCSVSFTELERGAFGQGEQAAGGVDETYFFGKRELLEYSVVNIPSNRNAQKRYMRQHASGALAYVARELGSKFRLSQIEELRLCDVLDLLDGKDVEIRSTDPDQVRKLLEDIEQQKRRIATLEGNLKYYKRK